MFKKNAFAFITAGIVILLAIVLTVWGDYGNSSQRATSTPDQLANSIDADIEGGLDDEDYSMPVAETQSVRMMQQVVDEQTT